MTDIGPEVLQITLGDQVIVKNVGDFPLEWFWGNRRFVLQSAKESQVSFDLMKKECGDPRSSERAASIKDEFNGLMTIPPRGDEVNRLLVLHSPTLKPGDPPFPAYVPGDRTKFVEGEPFTDRAPRVEVYTLDGQRIYTVLDDPYGDHVVAANPTRSDMEFTQATLRTLAEENREMKAMLKKLTARLDVNLEDLGPDLPLGKQAGAVAPSDGSLEGQAALVLNQRTNKVQRRRTPVSDPSSLDDLPEDD